MAVLRSFYTNISTVFAPCNNYNDAASCNAATKNYCSWNTSNSPSCNAPVTEAYAALAGIEVVGCLVGVKSTFCDFLTNTMNYCNMTTKDACNANANCIHSSGSCGPKPSRVYVIAGEVGKSLGSTHAASLASIANQCSTYNTSATCSAAKTNSAASVASGAGMLVIAVAAGLAALML